MAAARLRRSLQPTGTGGKPKLNDDQKAQVKQWVEAWPRQLKPVLRKIKETWDIKVSRDTLNRVLKAFKMSWRRMRRVPAKKDNETDDISLPHPQLV